MPVSLLHAPVPMLQPTYINRCLCGKIWSPESI